MYCLFCLWNILDIACGLKVTTHDHQRPHEAHRTSHHVSSQLQEFEFPQNSLEEYKITWLLTFVGRIFAKLCLISLEIWKVSCVLRLATQLHSGSTNIFWQMGSSCFSRNSLITHVNSENSWSVHKFIFYFLWFLHLCREIWEPIQANTRSASHLCYLEFIYTHCLNIVGGGWKTENSAPQCYAIRSSTWAIN